MKQKIVVRAIIRDEHGRTLFLRRKDGRPSIEGKFELPGGKMIIGEQPADAIKRTLKYHTGLAADTVQLFDIIAYVDPDDQRLEYLFIVYLISLGQSGNKITLDSGYDKYIWKKKSELQQNVVTESTKVIIGLDGMVNLAGQKGNRNKFVIYTDGGSRGNPGPSAAGFVIVDKNEDIVADGGRYLGVQDNTYAEYAAILLALSKSYAMGLLNVELRSDSLSTVNQINGINTRPEPDVMPILDRINILKKKFSNIKVIHIRRDFNMLADGVVNRVLDEHENN
ncbi:MAG: reverse transcriptase-like protein [Candidatus Nomurabacteria bacterium]|jgi:mutator protein MutT|nr:reverse transcriptase-like protein [Candidatus Nomurabacteria bacterium]